MRTQKKVMKRPAMVGGAEGEEVASSANPRSSKSHKAASLSGSSSHDPDAVPVEHRILPLFFQDILLEVQRYRSQLGGEVCVLQGFNAASG